MNGLMQQRQLLISDLIEHAANYHGDREIVSHLGNGNIHRYSWSAALGRSKQVANLIRSLGVRAGQRVATLAWNTHRHLELYYGVSGTGAVLTTVNPRLFAEQIVYILNHSESTHVFFDVNLAALVEEIAPQCPGVRGFIALCEADQMPDLTVPGLACYESLITACSDAYAWPRLDEDTASSMCFTSGTTGNPKGVLYSHRSTVLHAMSTCMADSFAISARDSILLIVPMFHVNGWGIPHSSAMAGAKLVLPGSQLSGENVYAMLRDEKCSVSCGVPTVWMSLLDYAQNLDPERRRRDIVMTRALSGGSAAPRRVIERLQQYFGACLHQAWGMTETSPVVTVNVPLAKHAHLTRDERLELQMLAGRPLPGTEIAIFDDAGNPLARDGQTTGQLKVRGTWISRAYYKHEHDGWDANGWFATGDMATLNADGFLKITDRAKDVIKSGGEWISSLDLESAALSHPAIAEAAVIGLPHSHWQERPLLVAVRHPGMEATTQEILDHMRRHVAKWWLPDDVVFVDSLPHTATGKLYKVALRKQLEGFRFSTDIDHARG
ncbi:MULTISPECIES: long-chain fatty acid--CoA ligase [unclassified Burkholderia]|uniref:long-chain fatty acid--CoA ligase n=1 Tax=unclassified Burkholderia TaxID=2613784 RepID=UPI000F59BE78|nr:MULTISPECIES: long-chain fatty acid--CoA ligase [unclassified Burkholderia]RQR31554.1 long-chain fatty acid--CoA ligase [Burkholderia sp. Bp9131]RQR70747.1 long-chain fatty acid--CoA ligase [Burkholderia sp. Bp9015]